MIRYVFTVLFTIHVLGDFYFQTENMAQRKKKEFKWVLLHSIIYAVISLVLFSIIAPGLPGVYALLFAATHGIVDILKYIVCNSKITKNKAHICSKKRIFITDQIIHIMIIDFIAYSTRNYAIESVFNNQIRNYFDIIGVSEVVVLSWLIKILLIHKPANIFISNILEKYKPVEQQCDGAKGNNAGRFIGTLERIIMTIFITINQYSVVGLVLTAKSITRYNKISEEPEFAEYYLLGTLLSTICAICVSILF